MAGRLHSSSLLAVPFDMPFPFFCETRHQDTNRYLDYTLSLDQRANEREAPSEHRRSSLSSAGLQVLTPAAGN